MKDENKSCFPCKISFYLVLAFLVAGVAGALISKRIPDLGRAPLVSPKEAASPVGTYCKSDRYGRVEVVSDCGSYIVLQYGCCDIPDSIVDRSSQLLASCGGFAGYSPECQQKFPQTDCKVIECGREVPPSEVATKEGCLRQGGTWQKWGLAGRQYCQIPAPDAGKSCTDGSQCSLGNCLSADGTVPGHCQTYKNTFGCFSYVESGQVSGAVCID